MIWFAGVPLMGLGGFVDTKMVIQTEAAEEDLFSLVLAVARLS